MADSAQAMPDFGIKPLQQLQQPPAISRQGSGFGVVTGQQRVLSRR